MVRRIAACLVVAVLAVASRARGDEDRAIPVATVDGSSDRATAEEDKAEKVPEKDEPPRKVPASPANAEAGAEVPPELIDARLGGCPRGTFESFTPLSAALCRQMLTDREPSRSYGATLATRDAVGGRLLETRFVSVWLEVESRHVNRLPVTVRTGMLPMPSLSAINTMWRRIAGPSGLEAAGLFSGSAVGSSVTVNLPARLGDVSAGVYHPNGFLTHDALRTGYLRGARVWLSPLDPLIPEGTPSPLKLLASTEDAPVASAGRGRRYVVGAAIEHRIATLGADRSYARGVADDASREARTTGAYFVVKPHARFDGFVRYDLVERTDRARMVTAGMSIRGPRIRRLAQGVDMLATFQRVLGTEASPNVAPDALTTHHTLHFNLNVRF